MPIKEYIHGKNDYQLWGNVGRLIVDKKVQEALGIHVTSEVGDVWWVNMTHKSETRGFASARMQKNKNLHLRYFYTVDDEGDAEMALKTLVMKAINYAKENGATMIYTNWHKDSKMLPKMGFVPKEKEKGKFCRWELDLSHE